MEETKTSREWCAEYDVEVVDPDGWNEHGKTWFEPLTREEFEMCLATSTTRPRRNSK